MMSIFLPSPYSFSKLGKIMPTVVVESIYLAIPMLGNMLNTSLKLYDLPSEVKV